MGSSSKQHNIQSPQELSASFCLRWAHTAMIMFMTGGSTPEEGEERIPFLARVRNKVLEPLWWPSHIGKDDVVQQDANQASSHSRIHSSITSRNISNRSSSRNISSSSSSSTAIDADSWHFKADKVVFLNDVYFCAQHVQRLLAHEGVNLACGLDYYQIQTAHKIPASWRTDVWGLQVSCAALCY